MTLMKNPTSSFPWLGLALTAVSLLAGASAAVAAAPSGMARATRQGEKMGAPVDVYYKYVAGATASNDPTLQLAVVPRVATDSLRVELLPGAGVAIDYGGAPMALAKTSAAGIYNRYLSVRRLSSKPATIQAIVTVDIGNARYASIFTLPADATSAAAMKAAAAAKPSRKQPLR